MVDLIKLLLENKLLSGIGALGVGFFGWKVADIVIFKVMARAYPERVVLKYVQRLDDEVIDKIKLKTPKVGHEIENRLVSVLEKAKLIVKDKI